MQGISKTGAFDAGKINAILADIDQDELPGAVVGVAVGGRSIYRRAFGLACVDPRLPLSIDMRVPFVSLHFLALAYLLLCEDGLAGIDDAVGLHVPDLHPVVRSICMRNLFCHTSGLYDVLDLHFQSSASGSSTSSADLLGFYKRCGAVQAMPGTRWIYNYGASLLIGAAVEAISGIALEEFLHTRIFVPAGLMQTALHRRSLGRGEPGIAHLHVGEASTGFEEAALDAADRGPCGLVSTLDDLLVWMAQLEKPRIGSPATWALMRASHRLANGEVTGYGIGLMSGRCCGMESLFHFGGGWGGSAQMLKLPVIGIDIVVLTNRGDISAAALTDRIVEAILPDAPSIRAPDMAVAEGIYGSPETGRVIELTGRNGEQMVTVDGFALPFEVADEASLRPSPRQWYSLLTQSLLHEGDPVAPDAIWFDDFGVSDRLSPLPPPGDAMAPPPEGRYSSLVADLRAEIRHRAGKAELILSGDDSELAYSLVPIAENVWRAVPANGALSAIVGVRGTDFTFSTWRTRMLRFTPLRLALTTIPSAEAARAGAVG